MSQLALALLLVNVYVPPTNLTIDPEFQERVSSREIQALIEFANQIHAGEIINIVEVDASAPVRDWTVYVTYQGKQLDTGAYIFDRLSIYDTENSDIRDELNAQQKLFNSGRWVSGGELHSRMYEKVKLLDQEFFLSFEQLESRDNVLDLIQALISERYKISFKSGLPAWDKELLKIDINTIYKILKPNTLSHIDLGEDEYANYLIVHTVANGYQEWYFKKVGDEWILENMWPYFF